MRHSNATWIIQVRKLCFRLLPFLDMPSVPRQLTSAYPIKRLARWEWCIKPASNATDCAHALSCKTLSSTHLHRCQRGDQPWFGSHGRSHAAYALTVQPPRLLQRLLRGRPAVEWSLSAMAALGGRCLSEQRGGNRVGLTSNIQSLVVSLASLAPRDVPTAIGTPLERLSVPSHSGRSLRTNEVLSMIRGLLTFALARQSLISHPQAS
jgi:hypothetical protein